MNITADGFHNSLHFDEKHFSLNGDDDDSTTMHNDENESDVDWIEIEHRLFEDHEIEADVVQEWIEISKCLNITVDRPFNHT